MSFMFNPYPFNDMTAVNQPNLSEKTEKSLIVGNDNINKFLNEQLKPGINAIEGHIGIDWDNIITPLKDYCSEAGSDISFVCIDECYKSQSDLDRKFAKHLPVDPEMDPVSLFGNMFEGDISELMNPQALDEFEKKIIRMSGIVVVYGCGCACKELVGLYDKIVYSDLTPMNIVLRARSGNLRCIGDETERHFKDQMRHLYYVDYEVSIKLRQELLSKGQIDYYIDCNEPHNLKLVPNFALEEIFEKLAQRPFRCKPCYIEGIWGGDYIKKLRSLPDEMRNCAWVFDLIPNEVSLTVQVGQSIIEFSFISFYRKMGEKLMGKDCVEKYHGVFPVRFNYDDTYHGGNMSIQLHPPKEYNNQYFGEPFQQDESYYVVFSANSRTYMGLKDSTNRQEFFNAVQKSEKDGSEIDYEKYVNSIVSKQGRQFIIPGGTIHSSGKDQVVLEIGSWTVGSYTFKMYDYLRTDLDGTRRPIHSKHGINVLNKSMDEQYVRRKLVPCRKEIRAGEGWSEYIIGEHEKVFFQLRCIDFYDQVQDNTQNNFHVLNLVEGQKVRVESVSSPDKYYEISYLEMLIVPACLGKYKIINLGAGPVRIHKTLLKPE